MPVHITKAMTPKMPSLSQLGPSNVELSQEDPWSRNKHQHDNQINY